MLSDLRAKEHSWDVHKLSKTENGSSIKHVTALVQKYIAVFAKHCAHPYVDTKLPKQLALQAHQKCGEGPRIGVSVQIEVVWKVITFLG